MMDVHHKGRAVVSSGSREEMERDVQAMHGYGLWATLTAGPLTLTTSPGRFTGPMAGYFEPVSGGGAAIALDEVEISILRSLAVQLLELIGPGRPSRRGRRPARRAVRRRAQRAARRPGAGPALPRRLRRPGPHTGRGGAGRLRRVPPLHRERPARPASATTRWPWSAPSTRSPRPGTAARCSRSTAEESPQLARRPQRPAADHRRPAGGRRGRRTASCTGSPTTTRASRW